VALLSFSAVNASASPGPDCTGLPTSAQLKTLLQNATIVDNPALSAVLRGGPGGQVGGLFEGTRMWGAIVNQNGELCALAFSTASARDVWPGSKLIAMAKAHTTNAFSLSVFAGGFPLSTAQLYTFVQPGRSLNSLHFANPQQPDLLSVPTDVTSALGRVPGGIITFGGGVALYKHGQILGGLGISGDTSCTDHEIAKRTRDLAGLNPPASIGGPLADDISYASVDGANPFTHPVCIDTWRNEQFIAANEQPAVGY
jgi:uncharacterized protein GlcG (DUF336 family)